jgi:hypothetical protein
MLDSLTFTYATGGISDLRPVNMVTSVNMDVTSRVTRPGIASRPIQKLNQDSITTSMLGANVWIKWCPI